jgi:integrase
MPFVLYAPGTRKNNPYWIALINIDGRQRERSLGTKSKREAQQVAALLEGEMTAQAANNRLPKRGEAVSFAQAARLYAQFRQIDLDNPAAARGQTRVEIRAINRLVAELGKQEIAGLGQADLVAAAERLLPGRAPATKNRWVVKPGAAILHYAAEQKLCGWERVRKLKETRPQTRAVSRDGAAELVAAAPDGPRRLLLVWLFRHGTRISDTLSVRWDNIDLARQTVSLRIHKVNEWTELPLHAEVVERLAAVPEGERAGRLFPWTQKSGVYRWLRPLARGLGIAFTPHMARHSVGTWLNAEGAGLRTIMSALHHADPQSSVRYQAGDVEVVRAATARFAPLTKKAAGQ